MAVTVRTVRCYYCGDAYYPPASFVPLKSDPTRFYKVCLGCRDEAAEAGYRVDYSRVGRCGPPWTAVRRGARERPLPAYRTTGPRVDLPGPERHALQARGERYDEHGRWLMLA